MSLGFNFNPGGSYVNGFNPGGGGAMGGSSSSMMRGLASLQTPSSVQNTANGMSANAQIPGINDIQMPKWLSTNPDSNFKELTDTYASISGAFDPTGQVAARNAAIGYNTSAGGQAANNAATEYTNRAAQSGASQLGAGVVKAQAMMPVLQQNAALKTDAADVAAKAHEDAAGLAAQVAGTIGQLRTSYLQTLTNYATGQQQLALNKYQAQQSAAGQAAQIQLGYANTNADLYKTNLAASQNQSSEARLAATSLLGAPKPGGNYTTSNSGQVTSGQDYYNQLQGWNNTHNAAQTALMGMI